MSVTAADCKTSPSGTSLNGSSFSGDQGLVNALSHQTEWSKAVIFDHEATVLASTAETIPAEVKEWLKLYDNREGTIGSGIIFQNEQYDVHRFHGDLIYGRRGDPAKGEGEGIALCRVKRQSTNNLIFCLITYTAPTVSARAVPQLQQFCSRNRIL